MRISKVNAIFCSDVSNLSKEFHKTHKIKFIEAATRNVATEKLIVIQSNYLAYVLFTSGSTGMPKGVPISLQNIRAFAENIEGMNLDISEQPRFLQVFELTFDLSVFSYLVHLLYGASVNILP